MSSINASKRSCKHPYEKSISPVSNNISLDESDLSLHTHETSIPGNSYTNTSSPLSSTSTTSIIRHPRRRLSKVRLKGKQTFFFFSLHQLKTNKCSFFKQFSKGALQSAMSSSKRRYRYEKLFHYTHSLNRQYIITMTNILFQMQKEIYKLNKRTRRVEHILANQRQNTDRPTIRIPRLTKGKTGQNEAKPNDI